MENESFDRSLRLIAKSGFIVFTGLFVSKIIAYIYRIIIARHFGPEIYGMFSIGLMLIGWFYVFSMFGLSEGILRFIPQFRVKKKKNKINNLITFSLFLVTITSTIAGIFLFMSAEYISTQIFNNSQLIIFIKLFSIAVPLSAITQILISVIRAFEKIAWYSFILNIAQNLTKLFSLIILIFIFKNSIILIVSYILGILVMFLLSYYVCFFKIPEIHIKKSFKKDILNKELFNYSWPLMFSYVILSIFAWTDTFLIGFFKDEIFVGIYNSALPLAALLSFTPFLFMQLFLPLINRKYTEGSNDEIKELSKQINKWIFIINMPLFFFLVFFPGVILNILFGEAYISAAIPLSILSIGFFIMSQTETSLNLLKMGKKSKLHLGDILIALIANLLLNMILIPRYGIIGAAIGTSISYIIYFTLINAQIYFYLKIFPFRKKMILVFLSASISSLILFFLKSRLEVNWINTILLGFIFLIVYSILILLTKSLDKNDFMIIQVIRSKMNF